MAVRYSGDVVLRLSRKRSGEVDVHVTSPLGRWSLFRSFAVDRGKEWTPEKVDAIAVEVLGVLEDDGADVRSHCDRDGLGRFKVERIQKAPCPGVGGGGRVGEDAKKEQVRSRKGKYAAECTWCGCPAGCACEGKGCGCGEVKAPTPRQIKAYEKKWLS